VEVKKPFFIVILAILLTGIILFQLSDTTISVANTGAQNIQVSNIMSGAGNFSASATITITMTGILNE
jgi:hypothetical protein